MSGRHVAALGVVISSLACGAIKREAQSDDANEVALTGETAASRATRDSVRLSRARTSHVIIVSIDGLRPDAIETYGARTLRRLMREGRYAARARTILPSTTIPSHTSMLTGVGPTVHRVLWNDDDINHRAVSVPSVFTYVRRAGLSTAAFFSKSKFGQLFPESAFDSVAAPSSVERLWPVEVTVGVATRYLASASPTLLFVHLAETDFAGHAMGWMTPEYGDAVRRSDAALSSLLAHADTSLGVGGYTLIVTGDHGGHARTHGSPLAVDTSIPWIVWGRGVDGVGALTDAVRTMDTAATALWLLGIDIPRAWSGRAVAQAFTPPPHAP